MATETCRLCLGPTQGRLEYVNLTIVCKKCSLLRFRSLNSCQGCFFTVSQSEAIDESGCLQSDLDHLDYLTLCQTTDAGPKNQRRYLRGEVFYLRNQRRKEALEKALGIRLKDIHPSVRHFLLRDYLTKLSESETSLEDVLVYKDVIHRATEIILQCPLAHPEAALDFCVQYPSAGLEKFLEMKNKVRKVFHLEGRRILHGLAKTERQNLKHGALSDVLEAFESQDSMEIIKGYLLQFFSEPSADAIMKDKGWREFDWANQSEDRVADMLMKFWNEKLHRKDKLMQALKMKGLSMPESSINCDDYMNGIDYLTLTEVVAGEHLTEELHRLDIKKGGHQWTVGFRELFDSLREPTMGHYASVRRAVNEAMMAIESNDEGSETESDSEDEEDD